MRDSRNTRSFRRKIRIFSWFMRKISRRLHFFCRFIEQLKYRFTTSGNQNIYNALINYFSPKIRLDYFHRIEVEHILVNIFFWIISKTRTHPPLWVSTQTRDTLTITHEVAAVCLPFNRRNADRVGHEGVGHHVSRQLSRVMDPRPLGNPLDDFGLFCGPEGVNWSGDGGPKEPGHNSYS